MDVLFQLILDKNTKPEAGVKFEFKNSIQLIYNF